MTSNEALNQSAGDFLKEVGMITLLSAATRRMLACIACQWLRAATEDEPVEYLNDTVSSCAGTHLRTAQDFSVSLEGAGLIERLPGTRFAHRGQSPVRHRPVDKTDRGITFQELLELPSHCPVIRSNPAQ